MKKLSLLISFFPVFLWGQLKIDFENGLPENHFQIPENRWGVSENHPLEGDFSLMHNFDNSESGEDRIFFSLPLAEKDSLFEISFYLQYAAKPSASNNWCILLCESSDSSHPSFESGLGLGVNRTGNNDSLYIYRYYKGEIKDEFNCGIDTEKDIGTEKCFFRLSFTPEGLVLRVELAGRDSQTCKVEMETGEVYPACISFIYSYTSSKDRLLKTDGIEFNYSDLVDSSPPFIEKIEHINPQKLSIAFDEKLFACEDGIEIHSNYYVEGFSMYEKHLEICFDSLDYPLSELSFSIEGLCDRSGNTGFYEEEYSFYYPEYRAIIFTEIMADPSPVVYLPEKEYLELLNRSAYTINLRNYTLSVNIKKWKLPEMVISPGEYLLITHIHEEDSYNCRAVGLFDSEYSLPNTGAEMALFTESDSLIDAVCYTVNFHERLKEAGGWSLERNDTDHFCSNFDNWNSSPGLSGGTPGNPNLANNGSEDLEGPKIRNVTWLENTVFSLIFDEAIDRKHFSSAREEFLYDNRGIDSIWLKFPVSDEIFVKVGKEESYVFGNILSDECGNLRYAPDTVYFSRPQRIRPGNIIISEVLFSTWPGCPEFVELYNNTDSVFSIADLYLVIDDSMPEETLSDKNLLFFPGEFLLVSKRTGLLSDWYDLPEDFNYIDFPGMRSLKDKSGKVSLISKSLVLIDEMEYHSEDHFPLLSESTGVSLERIMLNRTAGLFAGWHSASSFSGYASPGKINSVNVQPETGNIGLKSDDEVFTPDNDGDRDVAVFRLRLEQEGYVGVVRVFESSGIQVRMLANNFLLGKENTIIWDGRDDHGQLCQTGIYLIHMEAYHLSGKRKSSKETIVLRR